MTAPLVDRSGLFDVVWAGASSSGAVREHNEDAWLAHPPVFVVADGMGGHARGEVAAQAVIDVFEAVQQPWLDAATVCDLVDHASQRVGDLSPARPAPGSTLVGVGLAQQDQVGCWLFFNVGDSRAYLLRAGDLRQISVDHSRLQVMIERQGAAPAGAPRNVITRAIGAGMQESVAADQWLVPAVSGDRVVLCSDGLTGELSDPLIAATLLSVADPHEAASTLVNLAVEAGGHDNVTVLIVDAVQVLDLSGWGVGDPSQTTINEPSVDDAYPTADLDPADLATGSTDDSNPEEQRQ